MPLNLFLLCCNAKAKPVVGRWWRRRAVGGGRRFQVTGTGTQPHNVVRSRAHTTF